MIGRTTRVRAIGVLLWIAACWLSLATLVLSNDHFGRISPARQIAIYGDLPFRDYFDPGYFLTELSSAGLMYLLGDNLLGEGLLTSVFIASGTVVVFLLALRLTGSIAISLTASILALLMFPRAYDYDKVLFYPLGLLLCWRYVESPRLPRLWPFASGMVAAALFRYDNGVYLTAGMVVALAVVHAGEWRLLRGRLLHLVLAAGCLALPFLLFIQYQGGLVDAIDQIVTYARREAARTQVPTQLFVFDAPWNRAIAANADSLLSYLVRLLPLAAVAWLALDVRAGRTSRERAAWLASLITVCVCLNVFILRDPVGARFGGMAGPAAVLAAWIAHRTWREGRRPLRLPQAIVVLVTVVATLSVSASAGWSDRLRADILEPGHVVRTLRELSTPPSRPGGMSNGAISGLVRYLRECTAPTDRVLATWFVPDLYYFAQRGFAARTVALFGGHWSEPRFERRIVETLSTQSVPVVITLTGDELFEKSYPNIAAHLREHFELAGTSSLGDSDVGRDGYSIWVERDRRPLRTYTDTSLPCF